MKRLQTIALLVATGALLAVPAVGQAGHGAPHGKAKGKNKPHHSRCVVQKGFVVKGTLGEYLPGAETPGDETVTIDVTTMNRHASRAGLHDEVDGGTLQYKVTNSGDDAFSVVLSDAVPATAPGPGDKVRIVGKVAVRKKKCAPNATLEQRYEGVNIRRVKIIDAD